VAVWDGAMIITMRIMNMFQNMEEEKKKDSEIQTIQYYLKHKFIYNSLLKMIVMNCNLNYQLYRSHKDK